jgi:hypothetical protein
MGLEYYFNNLDSTSFQRLINAILVSRFGEAIRLLPLRGKDGGRDAETPPGAPVFEITVAASELDPGLTSYLPKGRCLFQVKHHRTVDIPAGTARSAVISDFEAELSENVLPKTGDDKVNAFFLVTNVPSSKEAVAKVDDKRRDLITNGVNLHAEVLWGEHVTAWLDQSPQIWPAFPDLFAGRVIPQLGEIANDKTSGLSRSIRSAVALHFSREGSIRFRQIELEEQLTRLFVDLAASPSAGRIWFAHDQVRSLRPGIDMVIAVEQVSLFAEDWNPVNPATLEVGGPSCIRLLTMEESSAEQQPSPRRIILEGGPGQGKSTMTQMVAQIYRAILLDQRRAYLHLGTPSKARLPIRIELRIFAEWMDENHGTIEGFIARMLSKDSGGALVTVDDIHRCAQETPLLLIFDGLDEIGSDESRDAVLTQISECLERLETGLKGDVKVILTTRPPAIAGRGGRISGFMSVQIASLDDKRMDEYISKWTDVRCSDDDDRQRVIQSFNKRRQEPHVKALAKNPMQLSVLLHFIRSQGEAFPDRRAELYRDYFKTVIDRDVEKTPRLRTWRGDIEALHELVAFKIHGWAETERSSGSISRRRLISVVEEWLRAEDRDPNAAKEMFRLGEERLGLIVALSGEGGETKYGFEIQPVREYFAAAYINERLGGNAHDLFEAMARRSFWREVALLLAGLRRTNEKADLLSRAQNLDADPDLGWRQDGRNIVLELLQEGVLASPGGVQRDSLLFLLQALDPSDRHPKNEATDLLTALPGIVRACSAPVLSELVAKFLVAGLTITDAGALERLYTVAHRTLSSSIIDGHLRGLVADGTSLSALKNIRWPDASRSSMLDLSRTNSFWPGMPSREWAAVWYEAALEDPSKANLWAQDVYHPLLFECFAFRSIYKTTWAAERRQPFQQSESPWAVWRLRDKLVLLSRMFSVRDPRQLQSSTVREVQYSGLDGVMESTVRDLVESALEINHFDSRTRFLEEWDRFLLCVVNGLRAEGISGWIACRCAVSLLEGMELGVTGKYRAYVEADGRMMTAPARTGFLGIERLQNWKLLRTAVSAFYQLAPRPYRASTAGFASSRRIVRAGFPGVPPDQVRLELELHPLIPMILAHIGGDTPRYPWLSNVPIPRVWLRELLSGEKAELPLILAHLSSHHTFSGPAASLTAPIMQKVLGVARRTMDPRVCSGVLVALLDSEFWALVDNETILKLISADSEHADVASRLFTVDPGNDTARARRLEIAQSIVNQVVLVSRSTGVAAARYVAANAAFTFPPLSLVPASPD